MVISVVDKDYLEIQKEILNEISDENVIYEESQCGPQEEPYLKEYKLDIKKWKLYYETENRKGKYRFYFFSCT